MKVVPTTAAGSHATGPNDDGNNNGKSVQDIVLDTMSTKHIRVAVVGNVDSGKSTLIGSLVSATLDDGRGMARSKIIKHKHELNTGRTSSISTHLLGLVRNQEQYQAVTGSSYQDIVLNSDRLVTLMDLAGHEKYLKTTVSGLSRGMCDYALVLVNAGQSSAVTNMTLNHLQLCMHLNIPVIVVFTKSDRSSKHVFQDTKQEVVRKLKSKELGEKKPFMLKNLNDVELVHNKLGSNLVPMLLTSCLNGEGLDLLRELLALLPQRRLHAKKQRDKSFEYLVEDIYQVPGVGTVLSGFVTHGEWKKGDPLYLGPLKDDSVTRLVPKSVHVAQTLVDSVWAGHSVCFAIPKLPRGHGRHRKKSLLAEKGMVAKTEPWILAKTFEANIYLPLGASVTVHCGKFDACLHLLNNKQSAKVIAMRDVRFGTDLDVIRQGNVARVTFEFAKKSYVRQGMRVIVRSGHVVGYGNVVAVY